MIYRLSYEGRGDISLSLGGLKDDIVIVTSECNEKKVMIMLSESNKTDINRSMITCSEVDNIKVALLTYSLVCALRTLKNNIQYPG
jgi:hypothetical protein